MLIGFHRFSQLKQIIEFQKFSQSVICIYVIFSVVRWMLGEAWSGRPLQLRVRYVYRGYGAVPYSSRLQLTLVPRLLSLVDGSLVQSSLAYSSTRQLTLVVGRLLQSSVACSSRRKLTLVVGSLLQSSVDPYSVPSAPRLLRCLWRLSEDLLKFYRLSIDFLSKLHRDSTEIQSKFY